MLVTFKDYAFGYTADTNVIADINLNIAPGSFNVLFGRSGSGKTTLLQQLKRVLLPSGHCAGTLTFNSAPITTLTERQAAQDIGYVNQHADAQFVTDQVWHELAFGLERLATPAPVMHSRIAEMATFFGITELLNRDVHTLSGGQKQLVNLASVMVLRPQLLLLDEPTAQLDPLAKNNFIHALTRLHDELGTTILLAEHELEDLLQHCDQLIMMDAGHITASGTPAQVSKQLAAADKSLAAFPVATQLYYTKPGGADVPMTVGAGRTFLQQTVVQPAAHIPDRRVENGEPWLVAKHVAFRYAADAPDTVSDINLTIPHGAFYGIVGSNGAGKSTLLALLGRILRPTHGSIRVAGKKLSAYTTADLYTNFLAVLPQDPTALFGSTSVQDELLATAQQTQPAMGAAAAVSGVAELCHLQSLLTQHPFDLSGGEQQLLALAKIILLRPQVLLLDEPTNGLDATTKLQVGQILDELHATGVTIVTVTHDLDFIAAHATTIAMLFDGTITAEAATPDFFAANSFYTTTANRIARDFWPHAVTLQEVQTCLAQSQTS